MMNLADVFFDFVNHAEINLFTQINSFISIINHFAISVSVTDVISSISNDNNTVLFILKTVMLNDITMFDD